MKGLIKERSPLNICNGLLRIKREREGEGGRERERERDTPSRKKLDSR